MRLSEAMRIGASWSKQISILFKNKDGTCALGAVVEGTFGNKYSMEGGFDSEAYRKINKIYPYLDTIVEHPLDFNNQKMPLRVVIYLLNDLNGWTREEIADWIEMIELELGYYDIAEEVKENIPVQVQ